MEDRRMKSVVNTCKQYKGVLVIVLLGLAFIAYYFSIQTSLTNPFDEMIYSETQKFRLIDVGPLSQVIKSKASFNLDKDDFKLLKFETSNVLNVDEKIYVFVSQSKQLNFTYTQNFEPTTEINFRFEYDDNAKTLKITSSLSVNVGTEQEKSYHGQEMLAELAQYGKDKKWLETEEKRVLNDVILKVWFEKGKSRYSASNLGDLKIQEDTSLNQ